MNIVATGIGYWRIIATCGGCSIRSPILGINQCPDLHLRSLADSFAAAACRRLSYIVKRFIVVASWRQFVAPQSPVQLPLPATLQPPSPSPFRSPVAAADFDSSHSARCMCRRHDDDAHLTTTVMLIGCFVNTNLVNDVACVYVCVRGGGEGNWELRQIAVDCQARTVGDPRCQLP